MIKYQCLTGKAQSFVQFNAPGINYTFSFKDFKLKCHYSFYYMSHKCVTSLVERNRKKLSISNEDYNSD